MGGGVRIMCAFPCVQADKLLSPEFQLVIAELIGFLPENRQLCMYSATFPVTVKDFKVKEGIAGAAPLGDGMEWIDGLARGGWVGEWFGWEGISLIRMERPVLRFGWAPAGSYVRSASFVNMVGGHFRCHRRPQCCTARTTLLSCDLVGRSSIVCGAMAMTSLIMSSIIRQGSSVYGLCSPCSCVPH
jgi:hypothetical protein